MTRRRLLQIICLESLGAGAAVLLAACDGSDSSSPAPGTTAVAVPPATTVGAKVAGSAEGALASIPFTTKQKVTLNGAGASFPYPLYSKLAVEYNKLNPGIRVNYQSIGSGGGIRQVIEKTVDFGGTDGPMSDEQMTQAGGEVLHIPTAMGAVAVAYNLPGSPAIKLSQEALAAIFLGKLAKWNDPAIGAENPGVELPEMGISVIHRSDGSGTTFIFTDYLAAISSEWKEQVGVATSVKWPVGVGAKGNEGVAAQVKQIPGAIGYIELAYAHQSSLPAAQLRNQAGRWVSPSAQSVNAAAAGMIEAGTFPNDLRARVVNAPDEDAYGIAGFTWLLVYNDLSVLSKMNLIRAQELVRYLLWVLSPEAGQTYHSRLDYAPLDPLLLQLASAKLKAISFGGAPVWESMI